MKVLWLTNTPCSAVEKLGMDLNFGGWLRSLEEELNKVHDLDLAICFYYSKRIEPFNYKGTRYYPIYREYKSSKFGRFINRLCPKNNDEKEIIELLKVVKEFAPDIIHVHGTEDNFGLIQYHTNIPTVISIQGILTPYAEKYYAGVPYSIVSRYEGLAAKLLASSAAKAYAQFNKKAERERRILINAKYIIGRTDWDKHVTRVLAPKSQYFIGNEIIRKPFYENVWNKTQLSETIQIITSSRDSTYKGFEAIVNAAQILKENTTLKFVWKVIGLEETSDIVKIVKKWKKVNLKELHIEFLGVINEKEIIKNLLQSDIYIQTSHIENSPNSLCEAMLLGMPIISTSVGGTSTLLKNNEEGILLQDGDANSLVGAILEMVKDQDRAMKLKGRAREKSMNRHDKSLITSSLLSIYRSIHGNV